jgi:hypothetical protein
MLRVDAISDLANMVYDHAWRNFSAIKNDRNPASYLRRDSGNMMLTIPLVIDCPRPKPAFIIPCFRDEAPVFFNRSITFHDQPFWTGQTEACPFGAVRAG